MYNQFTDRKEGFNEEWEEPSDGCTKGKVPLVLSYARGVCPLFLYADNTE